MIDEIERGLIARCRAGDAGALTAYADWLESCDEQCPKAKFLRLWDKAKGSGATVHVHADWVACLVERHAAAEHCPDDWLRRVGYAWVGYAWTVRPNSPTSADPIDRSKYVYEGPNGTPRPRRDISPNTRLSASLADRIKAR